MRRGHERRSVGDGAVVGKAGSFGECGGNVVARASRRHVRGRAGRRDTYGRAGVAVHGGVRVVGLKLVSWLIESQVNDGYAVVGGVRLADRSFGVKRVEFKLVIRLLVPASCEKYIRNEDAASFEPTYRP